MNFQRVERIARWTTILLLAAVIGFVVFIFNLPGSARYSTDRLRGWTADQVVAEFGVPLADSREGGDSNTDFNMTYTRGAGKRHLIHFKDGVVAHVEAYTK